MCKYISYTLLFSFLLATVVIRAAQLPSGFIEKRIATGLDPTRLTIAPDGRIFIAEKNGTIRIIRDEILLDDPFLTIDVDNFNERGLSGLAFHPDFEQNNYLYIYYTVAGNNINRVSRLTANGDLVVPGSEKILIETEQLAGTIHNAGDMVFGEDGKLYIAIGDGAVGHLPQERNSLLGKILRINDDGSIPQDNPFYQENEGRYKAVWATGLRNPFTLAYQRGTRRIFITDVGSNKFEEVNDIVKGGNYGWNIGEGSLSGSNLPQNYRDPIHFYDHDVGCSVIGAAFYNPLKKTFPEEYHGNFFFADYCKGWIKRMDPETGEIEQVFATGINRPISIVVADNGDMYYIERNGIGGGSMVDNTSTNNGTVWRISYQGTGTPFISSVPEDVLIPIGESASFRTSANGSEPLHFQWFRNSVQIEGANDVVYVEPSVELSMDSSIYYCVVSNDFGSDTSASALLRVTSNTRPVPHILSPEIGSIYRAGDTLFYNGLVMDAEDGQINTALNTWKIDFHHDQHTHPGLAPTSGMNNGIYLISRAGEISSNVWYRVWLSAIDSDGLTGVDYVDVFPEIGTIRIDSEPSGLALNADGRSVTTPHQTEGVIGILRTVQAPSIIREEDKIHVFKNWASIGESRLLTYITDQENSFKAVFDEVEVGKGIGLRGHYHNNSTHGFQVPAEMSRLDKVIDFDWGAGSPDPVINNDHFTIRWKGEILPLFDGKHTFYTFTDDGARLWIDDEIVINQWVDQAPKEALGKIDLKAGQRYPLRMEYYENGGGAVARLSWSHEKIRKEIVPKAQLFPEREVQIGEKPIIEIVSNPVENDLNLCIKSKTQTMGSIRIVNLSGRQMSETLSFLHLPLLTEIKVPVSDLYSGLYLAEIEIGDATEVLKFVKI